MRKLSDTPIMQWSKPVQHTPRALRHFLTVAGVGEFDIHAQAEAMLDRMAARHPDADDDQLAVLAIEDAL